MLRSRRVWKDPRMWPAEVRTVVGAIADAWRDEHPGDAFPRDVIDLFLAPRLEQLLGEGRNAPWSAAVAVGDERWALVVAESAPGLLLRFDTADEGPALDVVYIGELDGAEYCERITEDGVTMTLTHDRIPGRELNVKPARETMLETKLRAFFLAAVEPVRSQTGLSDV